jgi:predicted nuclease of predicted toxin-antitoxin system
MMRLKLDENLDHRLAAELIGLGHDAHSAYQEGLVSCPDERVWDAAVRENRTLVTCDRDFGDNRRFPPGRHAGIVVIQPGVFSMPMIRSLLLAFLSGGGADNVQGSVCILEPGRTRFRRPEPHDDPRFGPESAWTSIPLHPPKDT